MTAHSAIRLFGGVLAFALTSFFSGLAMAQAEESVEASPTDAWKFSVGAGVVTVPKYPGSDQYKVRALPILGASYGRYFVGGLPGGGVPLGVGALIVRDPAWSLGVGLGGGLDKARKESDDSRLHGLGDIDQALRASVFGGYAQRGYALRGNVATDVSGKGQGTLASLELEGRYALTSQVMLSAGPGLTWADRKYTQTFFGIDSAQSAASGRATYRAGSGLNSVRLSLGIEYAPAPRWKVGVRGSVGRLEGDAADSPITVDKKQNTVAVFGSYRF